jgi:cytoskeletal protein CcmA (bactofilin family)
MFLSPLAAKAFVFKSGNQINVDKTLAQREDLYAVGGEINLNTKAPNDVYAVGNVISVNSEIGDDAFLVAEKINVNAPVNGSIKALARTVRISGKINGDIMVLGQNLIIEQGAVIYGDLLTAGQNLEIKGDVLGNLRFYGDKLMLNGQIDKNANVNINTVNIGDDALIKGDFVYSAKKSVELLPNVVKGKVVFNQKPVTKPMVQKKDLASLLFGWIALKFLLGFIGSLLIGILLIWLMQESILKLGDIVEKSFFKSYGAGLLFLVVGLIGSIILMLMIFSFKLGFICMLIWLIAVWLADIVASLILTHLVVRPNKKTGKGIHILWYALSLLVVMIIFEIPLLGLLAKVVAVPTALGAMFLTKIYYYKKLIK